MLRSSPRSHGFSLAGVDWRAQVRAELALGGGLERLSDAERASIEEGRSLEAIFNSASNVRPLPWRLPGGQCDIAYVDGDPNPWCRCTATIPASVAAVLESIWEIEGESMRYHERRYRVRPPFFPCVIFDGY